MEALFEPLFDFFLPRFCPACKTKLSADDEVVCSLCLNKIETAPTEILNNEFKRKFLNNGIISDFTSLFIFEKDKELQSLIHALKYNKRFLTGVFLGKLFAYQFKEKIKNWDVSLIIPVPLHQLKKVERGYNQSYYIAKGLKKILKISVDNKTLKRKKNTKSQTSMNLKEREENISGAFSTRKNKNISGKNILLIDDVITTGATVSECGKVLLNAGAEKVFAASIAIAN